MVVKAEMHLPMLGDLVVMEDLVEVEAGEERAIMVLTVVMGVMVLPAVVLEEKVGQQGEQEAVQEALVQVLQVLEMVVQITVGLVELHLVVALQLVVEELAMQMERQEVEEVLGLSLDLVEAAEGQEELTVHLAMEHLGEQLKRTIQMPEVQALEV
jgi:hypothetical protein